MTPESLWVLKIICGSTTGFFGVLAAFFAFWEALRNEEHEPIREWFRKKWIVIKDSHWLQLPEVTITALLDYKTLLCRSYLRLLPGLEVKIAAKIFASSSVKITLLLLLTLAVNVLAICGSIKGIASRQWFQFLSALFLVCVVPALWITLKRVAEKEHITFPTLVAVGGGAVVPIFSFLVIDMILGLDIIYVTLVVLIILPLLLVSMALSLRVIADMFKLSEFKSHLLLLFTLSFFTSHIVTFFALFIGHVAAPGLWVPKTSQMLLSNVVFDGLTMVTTFAILSWAVARPNPLRIPIAVLADIVIAALLAWTSLYFGLVYTKHELSPMGIINVLIAKSTDGQTIELGPSFWVMHTTFLPTLFYCLLILVSWIGKTVLIPVVWFFGKGQENKNPLKLTATLCALIAAIFGFATFALGEWEKKIEQREKPEGNTISVLKGSPNSAKVIEGLIQGGRWFETPPRYEPTTPKSRPIFQLKITVF